MCKCKCVWWMVLEWNVFEDVVCSRISICTPVGIRKAFACMCMGGWYFACSMPNYLRARW